MAAQVRIDDRLIQKAMKLGGHRTKRAAVTQALVEYVQRLEQLQITELFGTVEYDPSYDYKRERCLE